MIIKRTLTNLIDLFLTSCTNISTQGFMIETDVSIESSTNATFHKVKDLHNKDTPSIGLILSNKINKSIEINKQYKVIGWLKLNLSKNSSSSSLFVNLIAESIEEIEGSTSTSINILDVIKSQPIQRKMFPEKNILNVYMICPNKNNSEATIDIESAILSHKIDKKVKITKHQCHITNISSVATAISQTPEDTDILVVVRGGGDKYPIQLLDNELIVAALNRIHCYKMLGTGHASDRLAIEMMFDYVAAVPREIADKLAFEINQRIEINNLRYKAAEANLEDKNTAISELKTNLDAYETKYLDLLNTSKAQDSRIYELQHQINRNINYIESSKAELIKYKIGLAASAIVGLLFCYLYLMK